MEIGAQIRRYRNSLGLTQDELADKIYVTRQTISNWETGKSYPDIHSLLRLGDLFNISLDQLIKGDVEIMKREIDKDEAARFNRLGKIFAALFIACIALFVPLVAFLKVWGVVIWAVLYVVTLFLSYRVEKLKRSNDIHTYREIVAFSEGKTLDEIQKAAGDRQTALSDGPEIYPRRPCRRGCRRSSCRGGFIKVKKSTCESTGGVFCADFNV